MCYSQLDHTAASLQAALCRKETKRQKKQTNQQMYNHHPVHRDNFKKVGRRIGRFQTLVHQTVDTTAVTPTIWQHIRLANSAAWYLTQQAKAKENNTCIAPQAAHQSCSDTVHVIDSRRTVYKL